MLGNGIPLRWVILAVAVYIFSLLTFWLAKIPLLKYLVVKPAVRHEQNLSGIPLTAKAFQRPTLCELCNVPLLKRGEYFFCPLTHCLYVTLQDFAKTRYGANQSTPVSASSQTCHATERQPIIGASWDVLPTKKRRRFRMPHLSHRPQAYGNSGSAQFDFILKQHIWHRNWAFAIRRFMTILLALRPLRRVRR